MSNTKPAANQRAETHYRILRDFAGAATLESLLRNLMRAQR